MKIFVKAKPSAKIESVRSIGGLFEKKDAPHFIVSVKEPPTDGKANRAIEKALAKYFKVPPSRVRIIFGHASRSKVVEIEEE